MISGLVGRTYEERLLELKLDSLEARRMKLYLAQTFKIIHGQDKLDAEKLFRPVVSGGGAVTRRAADDLNLEPPDAGWK